jgi:signal transduction histidine kinase
MGITPILIVSGTIQEEEAVESLREGADDFITKGPAIERSLREAAERKARGAAEDRLRQAEKMEAVGQLAGGVAHDFNNLLGVILGYGELLVKDPPGEAVRRERVDQILRAAQRGATLTRPLLTFSRQQPAEARPIDLNAVVVGLEPMLTRLIGEHVEVSTELAERILLVRADPVQIEQVLLNLGVNARDAMKGGGRLIIETSNVDLDDAHVQLHPGATRGPHVLLTVSDTGHGMDSETLSHIFDSFFTTKEAGRGTGLGLSTVYGIVRKSGGHVGAYSEPGRGTTFKIYLPRTEEEPAAVPSQPRAEARLTGRQTVLLVEDEPALRVVIREVLQEGGYTVVEGASPEAALVAGEEHSGPIHLILTDVVMPRISGLEAGRTYPGRPPANACPVHVRLRERRG